MSAVDFHRYLASREWAVLREQVRERAANLCERGRLLGHLAPLQNVHHQTYERLGHERLEDLLGVCRPCHEYLSAKRNDDPSLIRTELHETLVATGHTTLIAARRHGLALRLLADGSLLVPDTPSAPPQILEQLQHQRQDVIVALVHERLAMVDFLANYQPPAPHRADGQVACECVGTADNCVCACDDLAGLVCNEDCPECPCVADCICRDLNGPPCDSPGPGSTEGDGPFCDVLGCTAKSGCRYLGNGEA